MDHLIYIRRALGFVWKSSKKWTIILLILQMVQAILPLLSLYMTKLIVDSIVEVKQSGDFQLILMYILIFGFLQLLLAIAKNYQQLTSETQSQLVSDYMSTIIINKAIEVDMSYYENSAFYNTFHQAQRQALYRPVQILRNLGDLIKNSFLLLSLGGLLLVLHWGIALVLILFAFPVAFVKWYYSNKLFTWEKNRTELQRESGYLNQVLTTDSYAKEVRVFNLGEILLDRFKSVRRELFDEKFRIDNQRAKAGIFAKACEIIAMTLCYAFIAHRTFNGSLSIGDLVMYFGAFQKGQAAIQSLLSSMVGLYDNRLFISHVFDLLDVKSLLKQPENPTTLSPLLNSITIDQVGFTYPQTDLPVLKNLNLELKKGEVVAFVGENGSGKTTLIKLLCRLYDPTSGTIAWDGREFNSTSLLDLRRRISVIHQDFSKYHFTVGENIQIGDLEKPLNEEKLTYAAEQSGAIDFIKTFPDLYDQNLGRWFKKGRELSGGQWQKVALSRAFYKDAEVIILDEPSSSIDPLAEAQIFEYFREVAKDKILILVTHRLYNLKIADKIIVLHEGEVVEKGTHNELIELDKRYGAMFKKQTN